MFWQAVLAGFRVLLHWEVYVVAFIYTAIVFSPVIAYLLAGKKGEDVADAGWYGCLMMLVQPVLQAIAVFVSVVTLFPLMMGRTEAAWAQPWIMIANVPGTVAVSLAIMLVLAVLGGMVFPRGSAVTMFLMGGTVVAFLTLALHRMQPALGIDKIEIVPGVLVTIGILLISGACSRIGTFAVAIAAAKLPDDKETLRTVVVIQASSAFGFIPIFI